MTPGEVAELLAPPGLTSERAAKNTPAVALEGPTGHKFTERPPVQVSQANIPVLKERMGL